jgi:hypothetical protein
MNILLWIQAIEATLMKVKVFILKVFTKDSLACWETPLEKKV